MADVAGAVIGRPASSRYRACQRPEGSLRVEPKLERFTLQLSVLATRGPTPALQQVDQIETTVAAKRDGTLTGWRWEVVSTGR